MATPAQIEAIGAIYDPFALCAGLEEIGFDPEACDHTFNNTRAVLSDYAPDVDANALVTALQNAGAYCDCEIVYNVCPDA